ncbi:MAG: NDP-sugar synthase [Anaerolineaceae bacterium]|nr:NDP-sugar synthase [Anaerolineaceae bacterium]
MIDYAIVIAAGNIRHHSRLIYDRPRAMLPVMGKPMVVRAMDLLYRAGIRHFMVVLGEEEGAVASYLMTHWMPNVKLEFTVQMGNLTRTLSDIFRREQRPAIITSYNTFVQSNFLDRLLHRHQEAASGLVLSGASMSLSASETHYYGQVEGQNVTQITTGKTTSAKGLILSDLAVLGDSCIEFLTHLTLNTQTFTQNWLDLAKLYIQTGGQATIADSSWILQVEADPDLLKLNKLLLDEGLDAHILSELPGTVQITPPVRIDPQVSVGQGAVVGPHTYLEAGCSIGQGAVVRRSIILQNTVIPAKETITDTIVSSKIRITASSST